MNFEEYIEKRYKFTLDESHSYDNALWVIWAEEYAEVRNQELINFLLEIEAWLTFNQTPDANNITVLRDDIKILIGKYEN